jgi:hypothetical protein
VVVGAGVVDASVVVLGSDAEVDSALWSPQPPTSSTSATVTVRWATRWLMLVGTATPPAVQRGEGSRSPRLNVPGELACASRGPGPQLQRPPLTTHPARPVGQRVSRVAVRSPRGGTYTLAWLQDRGICDVCPRTQKTRQPGQQRGRLRRQSQPERPRPTTRAPTCLRPARRRPAVSGPDRAVAGRPPSAPPAFAAAGPPREALAGFWRRLVAAFLDWLLIGILAAAIGALGQRRRRQRPVPARAWPVHSGRAGLLHHFHAWHDMVADSLVVSTTFYPPGEFGRRAGERPGRGLRDPLTFCLRSH